MEKGKGEFDPFGHRERTVELVGELPAGAIDNRRLCVRLQLVEHLFSDVEHALGTVTIGLLLEVCLGAGKLSTESLRVRGPVQFPCWRARFRVGVVVRQATQIGVDIVERPEE